MQIEMVVDEHGTLNTDADADVYGYGCLLIEAGSHVAELEREVLAAFPHGFHLKNYRGDARKLSNARRLLALAERVPQVIGRGHVQSDPAYAREKYFGILAGRLADTNIPSRAVLDAIAKAPTNDTGLVDPSDIAPLSKDSGRLLAAYSHVLRTPVIDFARRARVPLEVRVRVGHVGREPQFKAQVRHLAPALTYELERTFERLAKEEVIPALPISISVEFVDAKRTTSLFGFADLFAGVALHCYRHARDPSYSLGKRLYEVAAPVMMRLDPSVNPTLVPGVTVMGRK